MECLVYKRTGIWMERIFYDEIKKHLQEMIDSQFLSHKNIFLFGYCEASRQMLQFLKEKNIVLQAVLDNHPKKQGTYMDGAAVVEPKRIMRYRGEDTVVLIASRAYEAMAKQLHEMNYGGAICKVADYNSFAEFSLTSETVDRKLQRMLRGKERLDRLHENKNMFLFICPFKALGDVYLAMAYLPYYLQENKIKEYMVVVVGDVCAQVVQMFNKTDTVILTQVEMDELVQAAVYTCGRNIVIAHHDRPYTNDMTGFIDTGKLSFRDLYCCGVYGLKKGLPPIVPQKMRGFSQKELLKKGKSLIIAPYAKSVVTVPTDYWIETAEEYKRKGFTVFTNVVGEEKPIEGTMPIRIEIAEMISAVEYAGYFIGVRSGICDIIDSARCYKKVIFMDCFYSSTNTKVTDFFGLPHWKTEIMYGNEENVL